jgi:hypothetical protein
MVQTRARARARCERRLLEEGRYASIGEMAAAEKLDRGYVGRVLRLTLLAPDIVEAILDGRQPEGLALPKLMDPLPVGWDEQCVLIAEAVASAPPCPRVQHPSDSVACFGPLADVQATGRRSGERRPRSRPEGPDCAELTHHSSGFAVIR